VEVHKCKDSKALGQKAAEAVAKCIQVGIALRGGANIVVATGASQFETLAALVTLPGIEWNKVRGFHLDEYIGLSSSHRASFCGYLRERFVNCVSLKEFHFINGENDPLVECHRLNGLIASRHIDVALIGIGENGHIAFNDPPADFDVENPYIIVSLDAACRAQQVGEGWFETLGDVPEQAISMSVRQIMKSQRIVCSVPDARKAQAVSDSLNGKVTPMIPASILQSHPGAMVFLDPSSARKLDTLREIHRHTASAGKVTG
jgi:glucosamine-6-phosphate deaminase